MIKKLSLLIFLGGIIGLLIIIAVVFFLNNPRSSEIAQTETIKNSNEKSKSGWNFFSDTSENNFENQRFVQNSITGQEYPENNAPQYLNNTPIGVMINNAKPARPQSGLYQADIVYEIVAEGGITRFLAVFWGELPAKVGPVRSSREYYLNYVKELGDAMYMHIGYSPQAKQRISDWNIKTLANVPNSFYRDNHGDLSIATEHTAYSNLRNLLEEGTKLGFNQKPYIRPYQFKKDFELTTDLLSATDLEISFWYKGDYTSVFKYNEVSNSYIRYQSEFKSSDRETFKDVDVKNVIVMFADEFPIPNDDKNRLDYKLIGEGQAIFFRDGKVERGIWKKSDLNSRTLYYNQSGEEIKFNRGRFWVSIVPTRNIDLVVYK
jgi:hypothetical protein